MFCFRIVMLEETEFQKQEVINLGVRPKTWSIVYIIDHNYDCNNPL